MCSLTANGDDIGDEIISGLDGAIYNATTVTPLITHQPTFDDPTMLCTVADMETDYVVVRISHPLLDSMGILDVRRSDGSLVSSVNYYIDDDGVLNIIDRPGKTYAITLSLEAYGWNSGDTDEDGIPNNADDDDDNDGVSDSLEIQYGTDPLDPDEWPGQDTEAPTATILEPTEGTRVPEGLSVRLVAEAEDNEGVVQLNFAVDGKIIATLSEAPYAFDYTMPVDVGTERDYVLTAIAVDAMGNEGISDPIVVHCEPYVDLVALGETCISETDTRYDNRSIVIDGGVVAIDGAHLFNHVLMRNGAVLTHSQTTTDEVHSLNLAVYHLTIDETSTIDVSGRGYLGGGASFNFSYYGRTLGNQNGSMRWSGGSYGGLGGQPFNGYDRNPVYGNFFDPTEPGSGGGGNPYFKHVGGNGGGLIRIMATTIQLDGEIIADGLGSPTVYDGTVDINAGGGSGGGIRIDALSLAGTGTISAVGGSKSDPCSGAGGGGRIAIYCEDLSGFTIGNIAAHGGDGWQRIWDADFDGGAGTIYLKTGDQTFGTLIIDNNDFAALPISTPLNQTGIGKLVLDELIVTGNASVDFPDSTTATTGDAQTLSTLYANGMISAEYLTVDNAVIVESVAPSVEILSPSQGAVVAANLEIKVSVAAEDASGIKSIQLFVDGQLESTITSSPYILPWTVPDVPDGTEFNLTAVATDNFDNTAASSSVTVHVQDFTDLVSAGHTSIGPDDSTFDGTNILITNGTVTIDGAHTFANLLVENGGVLTHSGTTVDTEQRLDLTVNSLSVDASSRIDVSSKGYLGGERTGTTDDFGHTLGNVNGSYRYSGGSYGGLGGLPNSSYVRNDVYGDYTAPNELGSGGGGSSGNKGGNGGGLVRISATSLVLDGQILANGGSGYNYAGSGSGGGVRLDVTTLSGGGSISANGGSYASNYSGGGGGGRIAIYYEDMSGFDGANISAGGGNGYSSYDGGAGTIYLKSTTQDYGDLIIDNNGRITGSYSTPIAATGTGSLQLDKLEIKGAARVQTPDALAAGQLILAGASALDCASAAVDVLTVTGGSTLTTAADVVVNVGDGSGLTDQYVLGGHIEASALILPEGMTHLVFTDGESGLTLGTGLPEFDLTIDNETVYLNGSHTFNSIDIINGGVLTHSGTTVDTEQRLDLTVNSLSVDASSRIDVSSKGYLGGERTGTTDDYGHTLGNVNGSYRYSGGSYGGLGGLPNSSYVRNDVYGDYTAPNELGSGGGGSSGNKGGNGGGLVRISATSLVLDARFWRTAVRAIITPDQAVAAVFVWM